MPRQFRFTVPLKPIAALCNEDDTVVCKNKWFFFFLIQACWLWKKGKCHFFSIVCDLQKILMWKKFSEWKLVEKKCWKMRSFFFFFFSFCRSVSGLRVNGSFENYFTFQEMSHLTLIYRLKAALNTWYIIETLWIEYGIQVTHSGQLKMTHNTT